MDLEISKSKIFCPELIQIINLMSFFINLQHQFNYLLKIHILFLYENINAKI